MIRTRLAPEPFGDVLAPATRGRTEVDADHVRSQQLLFLVDLLELEDGRENASRSRRARCT